MINYECFLYVLLSFTYSSVIYANNFKWHKFAQRLQNYTLVISKPLVQEIGVCNAASNNAKYRW